MTDTDNIKKQYESYKKELDTINKRYSETYIEPETDMPQSLGLSKIEYETPSDEQLRKKAEISLSADKQAAAEKISRDTSEKIKKQQTLKDKAFSEAVKQLIDIDREETETKREKENDALARNLARSSIASEGIKQVESYADEMRAQTERERDDAIDAISREIDALKRDASRALSENEKVFLSKLEAETERLRQAAEKEKREAEKYNNSIAEKEAEYGKELEKRAKELERQEWERLAASRGNQEQAGRKRSSKHEAKGNSDCDKSILRQLKSRRRARAFSVGYGNAEHARRRLCLVSRLSAKKKKRIRIGNNFLVIAKNN